MYWRMYFVHAVRRACILAGAVWLCAFPAAGQAIPDEGYPSKPVFPEESSAPPALHEECGPFLLAHPVTADAFAEECAGNAVGDNGTDGVGVGAQGDGSSTLVFDPALHTPPRLECPSAVFLEELETGAIDCQVSDAAGEEHLDYFWEPVGRATRDYLENPRLLPEDAPNPVVVAPSFPQYDTLESFLSDEGGAQRYRYRLTATSRATGLSSYAEVEVFVRSSQPGVYCPMELEVEEGATVVLACEGADPLSFRMDASDVRGGGSLALWEWEGLWGSSTAPLAATDTPQPVFTAPAGSAGRTYHYVASLTTSSSGVPRTARRRVSVTVKAGEGVAAPKITCPDSPYEVYEASGELTVECKAEDAPEGASYVWNQFYYANPPSRFPNLLTDLDTLVTTFRVPEELQDYLPAELVDTHIFVAGPSFYRIRMLDSLASVVAFTDVIIRVWEKPDINREPCQVVSSTRYLDEGDDPIVLVECSELPRGAVGDTLNTPYPYRYEWTAIRPTGDDALDLLSATDVYQPLFTPPDNVDQTKEYRYLLTISPAEADVGTTDPDYFTQTIVVNNLNATALNLACRRTNFSVFENAHDFPLTCDAPGATGDYIAWQWTARSPTPDTDRLSATIIRNPEFDVRAVNNSAGDVFFYRVTATDIFPEDISRWVSESLDITVTVEPKRLTIISCEEGRTFYEGDPDETIGNCTFARGGQEVLPGSRYRPIWRGERWTDSRFRTLDEFVEGTLSDTTSHTPLFYVPNMVNQREEYVYTLAMPNAGWERLVTVDVLDRESFDTELALDCGEDIEVYEKGMTQDIAIQCTPDPNPAPAGKTYAYRWEANDPLHRARLVSGLTTSSPTFRAPAKVDGDQTYTYRATVSADKTIPGSDIVNVTVKETPDIAVTCTGDPYSVYEGGSITLDCEGTNAPPDSEYEYAWAARGTTQGTGRLTPDDIKNPTFSAPDNVSQEETYEYTLTVTAPHAHAGTVDVTVTVLERTDIAVVCTGDPYSAYEGAEDIPLDCSASGAPGTNPTYEYVWAARNNARSTPDVSLLSAPDIGDPKFLVPEDVDGTTQYEYTVTATADNAYAGTVDVTVTVLERPDIVVACTENPYSAYEGAGTIPLDCAASGGTGAPGTPGSPGPAPAYTYAWTPRNNTGATPDVSLLSAPDIPNPTFAVPEDVDGTTQYEYTVTATADNADAGMVDVMVTVLERPDIVVTCTGNPYSAYEGAEDIPLDCAASGGTGAPGTPGSPGPAPAYTYAWTPLNNTGATPDVSLLSAPDIPNPTFAVPEDVPKTTKYEYLLTATADNADVGMVDVTVTVLNEGAISLACDDPEVYEGSPDLTLRCTASVGTGEDPEYTFAWAPAGSTPDVSLLSADNLQNPVFAVPDNVSQDETYAYRVTASAPNTEEAVDDVTVTVLNKPDIQVACVGDPYSAYEGTADITLACAASVESGAPGDNPAYTYAWTPRGATLDTGLLSASDVASPTFRTPASVETDETYEYVLTVTAPHTEPGRADVTVTVLNNLPLTLACTNPDPVYEGAPDIPLSCEASGATGALGGTSATGATAGSEYEYSWAPWNATPDVSLLSASDVAMPTFRTPASVEMDETYAYRVTVTAPNADPATADVTVTVLNNLPLALACTNPDPVYEGAPDIPLSCEASGAPAGSDYEYVWAPRNATPDVRLLSAADLGDPTFFVPEDVPQTTRYEYRVTARAAHADPASADVTVTVLNTGAIAVVCRGNPYSAYEGSPDITLNCEASGDAGGPESPEVSAYTYAWEALNNTGATLDTELLSRADVASPTFAVPVEVGADETYEYRLTVSAENAEAGTAEVTVTVLNKAELALACAKPDPVYEGAPDIALECAASGDAGDATRGVAGLDYEYAWTLLNNTGAMADTDLLSRADIASPTFFVPEDVPQTTRYEYQVTVSAENAKPATAEVTVTVLNKGALAIVCAGNPYSAYEGSEDIPLDCEASGAPEGSGYEYAWTPLNNTGATADTDRLSAADIASPTFAVPAEVDADETYEYLLTVSAENAEAGTVEVTVTVLNKGALALVCAGNPYSAYEGSEDITLDCAASGALEGSEYAYAWTVRGATVDTDLLSAADVASPTFAVPDSVDADETYEYLLTVSADRSDDATVDVTVTVLDRPPPAPEPVASSGDPSALGVRVSVSPLRFGVQSSDVKVSLDPLSEQISTSVSGPHHAGRMTLALDGALSPDEAEEMALSVELVTPVTLRRLGDNMVYEMVERSADIATDLVTDKTAHEISDSAANNETTRRTGIAANEIFRTSLDKKSDTEMDIESDKMMENKEENDWTQQRKIADTMTDTSMDKTAREISDEAWDKVAGAPAFLSLSPSWSIAESCESLSSQAIGGWHTEVRLSESDCRLLLFGGELDLSGAIPGRYAGNMDFILRTDSGEETHSIEVEVEVAPTQYAMLAGAEGVRFAGPDEVPLRLTEAQNVRISPTTAYLTRPAPSGAFALTNMSLIPLELSVSARFGYTEASEVGFETVVEDLSVSPLGDLSALVDIYPKTLILPPGEEGVIRYGVREEVLALMGAPGEEGVMRYGVREDTLALMGAPSEEGLMRYGVRADTLASMEVPSEEGVIRYGVREDTLASLMESGYAAFFEITSAPHQYVRTDQLPQAATVGKTAHVTMRIPGAYAPDERAPSLRAELISVSEGTSPLATFLVETEGAPFFGEVVAYAGDGRELGRRQTLVYTRSRVRMSLTRTPEGETVFLRFISSGGSSGRSSGPSRISEPVSVPWDAPQRDSRIGAAPTSVQTLQGPAPAPAQSPEGPALARKP